jgi:hypothetical protein
MNTTIGWRKILFVFLILLAVVGRSVPTITTFEDRVRVFTRSTEYDYSNWTLDAIFIKLEQASTDVANYLSISEQRKIVLDYIDLVRQMDQLQGQISLIYADPTVSQPELKAKDLLTQQAKLEALRKRIGAMAESVIQKQVSEVIAELGLSAIGQPIPPVLYHVTPLPMNLIVSPRNIIQQEASISLLPTLSLEAISNMENSVEKNLDVSALVVPVGGIGNYPTMVMSSSDLGWQIEVVGHEWIHNYLEFHPLGLNYDSSPELRTMNETTANIAGKEISLAVLEKYYPELVPAPAAIPAENQSTQPTSSQPEEFSFQKEMHKTRVHVDELLATGKITEAEAYMETERKILWDHGYQIRRLNQAYFAFYGAYADVPGGAAGEDPVGPAVNLLRSQSKSLADFIHKIAAMTTFQQLQNAVK